MQDFERKRDRLEKALYNWLDATDVVQENVLSLIDKNNVTKATIAKYIDIAKDKLATLESNLKKY